MTSWLDALIDPDRLTSDARRGDSRGVAGLALLLSGELFEYERLADDAGWPRIGATVRGRRRLDDRLLAAVGLHLTGDEGAESAYKSLLDVIEPQVGVVAAVLYAVYLSDSGLHDQATQTLQSALGSSRSPLERMFLMIHLGVRRADAGHFDDAIELTEEARTLKPKAREWHRRRVLETVAAHNVFRFRQQIGEFRDPRRLPSRSTEPALLDTATSLSTGLARFLSDQFEQVTRQPVKRGFVWRAEDPVEMPLLGGLLRAESLGDWSEQRRARALLGRYYTVSKLGTPDGVPSSAFDLLRRAGDAQGIVAAARTVSAIGPLGALRMSVTALLDRAWPAPEQAATLALLGAGADLLRTREADKAFARLRSQPDVLARDVGGLRALSRVLRSASDRTQTAGSRLARELARRWPNTLVLQHLWLVVDAIRWDVVTTAERAEWLGYAREHLDQGGDAANLAERVARALSASDHPAIAELLLDAYAARPSVDRLAFLVDAEVVLPPDVRDQAADMVTQVLKQIRTQAAAGSHSFGGTDVAQVLLALIQRSTRDPRWKELVDFLLDDSVAIHQKVGALGRLASPTVAMPRHVQEQLRRRVGDVGGVTDPLAGPVEVLHAYALRVQLRLGGVARDEVLGLLLQFAGDAESEVRREGARTLPAARPRLGEDTTITLALALTRDLDYSVRGAAGRALASLGQPKGAELGVVTTERLEKLLAEPGTVVPRETIAGLVEYQRAGGAIPSELTNQVRRVHRSHPSRTVMELAGLLLREDPGK